MRRDQDAPSKEEGREGERADATLSTLPLNTIQVRKHNLNSAANEQEGTNSIRGSLGIRYGTLG